MYPFWSRSKSFSRTYCRRKHSISKKKPCSHSTYQSAWLQINPYRRAEKVNEAGVWFNQLKSSISPQYWALLTTVYDRIEHTPVMSSNRCTHISGNADCLLSIRILLFLAYVFTCAHARHLQFAATSYLLSDSSPFIFLWHFSCCEHLNFVARCTQMNFPLRPNYCCTFLTVFRTEMMTCYTKCL